MTLTTSRRMDKDQLVITYRLDTGKLRLTAAELQATRDAVLALNKERGEHLIVKLTSRALANDGKLAEAVAECRRLVALHPKEALHHDQLSAVYRRVGLWEAARREAQLATKIEPSSADAFAILGWELARDTAGREYGFDADRKGAIAAYRKALALDPTHYGALDELARLLAHDERGEPTIDDRDRSEAIALWQRAKVKDPGSDADVEVAEELFAAGKLVEAEAAARALHESKRRSAILVAAIAASRGGAQAIAAAGGLPGDKATALGGAMGHLIRARRYAPIAALTAEIPQFRADPAWQPMFQRLAAVDVGKLDPADPHTPLAKLLLRALGGSVGTPVPWDAEMEARVDDDPTLVQFRGLFDGFPRSAIVDVVAAAFQSAKVEGSASDGWRVVLDMSGRHDVYYASSVGGRAMLMGSPAMPAGVGKEVLARLARGDLAGARRWLDQLAADIPAKATSRWRDLYRQEAARVTTLSKESLELFAALLTTTQTPIVKRCATTIADIRKACGRTMVANLSLAKQWNEAAAAARLLTDADPSDREATLSLAYALVMLGRTKDAAFVLDAALATLPDDHDLLLPRLQIATYLRAPDVQTWLAKVEAAGASSVNMLNGVAWYHGYFDATPADALAIAKRAEGLEKRLSGNLANTLAALEAESGDPAAAWKHLGTAIRAHKDRKPDASDLYVLGRIAEDLGLRDDAIALYRRVAKPDDSPGVSAYDFAQRNLKRMGVH
jgi:tetratricopeptide (TPR) repeat protein